jgi:hypothetical protein
MSSIMVSKLYTQFVALTNKEVYGDVPHQRVPVDSLSRDLAVNVDTVSSMAEELEGITLVRGNSGLEIMTKAQRVVVDRDLEVGATNGLVSKDEFARKHGLKHSGLDMLLESSELQILEVNGYLYSKSYDTMASGLISELLKDHIHNLQ